MNKTIIVPHRFRGPATSGNGGYTAGLIAQYLDGAAEVTIRAPIPLDRRLTVVANDDGLELRDGDTLIASACAGNPDVEPPDPPSFAEAVVASARSEAHDWHAVPTDFVCGTGRAKGDGLRLFPGPVEGREETLACPWIPSSEFADANGIIRPEIVWAALDSTGGFAIQERDTIHVLGRYTVALTSALHAAERYVIVAWAVAREGRRKIAGTALFDGRGKICARARAVWFDIGGGAS